MTNTYSPAHELFKATEKSAASSSVRYPSPPPALRWLRLQFKVLGRLAPELAFRLQWKLFCTPRRLPVKSWEGPALAGARRRTVSNSTGPVQVYEWGAADAPAVVLVHGWEHRASFWHAWVPPLLAAGYRAVALDGPAHGASAGRMATLTTFGSAVEAVLGTAGEVQAIVAHSFGAAVVAGLPVQLPGNAPLPRLVLLSAPESPREVARRFAQLLQLPVPKTVARFARHIHEYTGREADSFAIAAGGPTLGAEQIMLLHDEHDAIVPFHESLQIAAAWPQAVLCPTRSLGHNRILRDPDVVRKAVEFIRH
ncbi:alpha/beta fold hydrolase [Hymenobacter saemangeumensis]|uniref:Alpha/beta fold hydrolase n=1 Tax=Hymenobacter saemangeumensis TaxID=1084522 RepID=A0ABP8ISY1_9BACT